MPDVQRRFDELAARVGDGRQARPSSAPVGSDDDYWQHVQALFTRDVTESGLREMVDQDARETFRFFTRQVDLEGLGPLPWYRRWPKSVWRVFLVVAFRLHPARRLLFALAVPLLGIGWLRYFTYGVFDSWTQHPVFSVVLASATLLFLLLVLELRDKLALKGDLEIARQIQFGLLPFEPYAKGRVRVFAAMRPANTVGGDYFDIIELGEGRVAVVMGDVAGKGIPAALLMALLQGSLRTLITAGFRGAVLMEKLNAHLHANIPSNRLITLFYAEIDTATGDITYVNAGHNPPVLFEDGRLLHLAATGMALGVTEDAPYEGIHTELGPGGRLFLYTDGVTEAFNEADEEFGDDRLKTSLVAHAALTGPAFVEAVREDVLAFCGRVRPRDDMTLMSVEVGPSPNP